jgi:hypothetical protein
MTKYRLIGLTPAYFTGIVSAIGVKQEETWPGRLPPWCLVEICIRLEINGYLPAEF